MLARFKATNHPQQTRRRGPSDEIDDRATPPEVFGPLNERFGFTLDVAAAAHNAKCPRFFTRYDNGLEQSWAGESVWCNPPYSSIAPWVAKAWAEWERARSIAMLVPATRTEQAWWHEHIEPRRDRPNSPLRTEFRRGRDRFLRPGETTIEANNRPPFGCVVLIWTR